MCIFRDKFVRVSLSFWLAMLGVFGHWLTILHPSLAAEPLQFGRDILPILSANCFACHGPDEHDRQGELRLDVEAAAKADHEHGKPVVPHQPGQSQIIARIESKDPELVMPPPDSNKKLKPAQIELLRRWIAEGATWGKHWSFEPVRRPVVAQGEVHPIDQLVTRELVKKGLQLQPAAAPATLARRLSLDLIGLPPTPEMVAAFAKDSSATAYEKMVDDLLESPRFGEHWARMWLDLARYADTKGYEKDLGRTMWPYRDWVVSAFNADMPLDQFTVEQLAGDLLPESTEQQRVATAFHRNTLSNDEGGTDDEEFRTIAVKDRIDTTIQVWMGLTMGCSKCHSHKYDPISHMDYYRFYAIFNQTEDADRSDDSPTLPMLNDQQREEANRVKQQLVELEATLKREEAATSTVENSPWQAARVIEAQSLGKATLAPQTNQAIIVSGEAPAEDTYVITLELSAGQHTALRLEALATQFADGQWGLGRNEADPNFVVSELRVENLADAKELKLDQPVADFSQNNWPVAAAIDGNRKTGWAVSPRFRERHAAMFAFSSPLVLEQATKIRITLEQLYGQRLVLRQFRFSTASAEYKSLDPLEQSATVKRLREQIATAREALKKLESQQVKLPVLRELPAGKQRVTKIHKRGNFLDPGDVVAPGILPAFGAAASEGTINRLSVARWLVAADNPLTPRVWANRIWARLFGQGIVETEEDFGALGSSPSHPELLDWLAAEYRDQGWSLKKLLRTIVLSKTYQQASVANDKLLDLDPRNVYFSRGARFRLSAEVIRDQALAVSGLLSSKLGGPPVMPPQPEGLWRSTYSGQKWIDAQGEDRFRRGLYTYLKRTTPYPSFTTFDAGSGEVCQVRRIRTNTPLQALIVLNDPVYLEASGALALKMVAAGNSTEQRMAHGVQRALIRSAREVEMQSLQKLFGDARAAFLASPDEAQKLIATASVKANDVPPADLASWIVVANTILNLDEFLSRN